MTQIRSEVTLPIIKHLTTYSNLYNPRGLNNKIEEASVIILNKRTPNFTNDISLDELLVIVASNTGTSAHNIRSDSSRNRYDVIYPRYMYYLFARLITDNKTQIIGISTIPKAHATVLHGSKLMLNFLSTNDVWAIGIFTKITHALAQKGISKEFIQERLHKLSIKYNLNITII